MQGKTKRPRGRSRGRIDNVCAGEATWECTAPANSWQPSSPRLSLETEVPPTVSVVIIYSQQLRLCKHSFGLATHQFERDKACLRRRWFRVATPFTAW